MRPTHLDKIFRPGAVAVIGASNRVGSVGQVLARNLLAAGLPGPVMPVNPHERAVASVMAFPTIADLPMTPDLAAIAIPAERVATAVRDLGRRGCTAAVVITAGFEPAEPDGARRRAELLAAAGEAGVRLVGPNCLGVMNPHGGLNASFAAATPAAGDLGLISQSGAIAAGALDWAAGRGVGFSRVATVGDAIDLDVPDFLEHLAVDRETRAILLYVEAVADARRFLSAARFAAQIKPVILLKGGRGRSGAAAAYSHTGAMAGSAPVFEAAMRRSGVLQVQSLEQLFDLALLSRRAAPSGSARLAVLTNGGGAGVIATDALEARKGTLAALSPATIDGIAKVAAPNWSHRNPVDVLGDARPPAYAAALDLLLADAEVDAVLALNCPTALVESAETARAALQVIEARQGSKPVFTCWLGGAEAEPARALFARSDVPTYEAPERAVAALCDLADGQRVRAMLMQTPEARALSPRRSEARGVLAKARAEGRSTLNPDECLALLRAYGVTTVEPVMASDAASAAAAAARLGGPIALKIVSPELSHKTDVGGVMLNVPAERVAVEASAMLERIRAARPDATVQGLMVEPMIDRSGGQELIVGIAQDPAFGPVILFGQGGVYAEQIGDRAVGLPPLDTVLADDLVSQTRVAALLKPTRGRPGADLAAITRTLCAVADIAVELPEVRELDINPLVARPDGAIALDARVSLQDAASAVRPAITPYPSEWVREVSVGRCRFLLRPVRADDTGRIVALVDACSAEDLLFRFGGGMRHLPAELAARLSHIDYDRHTAFVAADDDGSLLGVARLVDDESRESGEFAILVASSFQRRGIGKALLQALLDYATQRGLASVWGETEVENTAMLALARTLGFENRFAGDGEMRMTRTLTQSLRGQTGGARAPVVEG